jgi:8-oxo-dGTP pyrophosphatase MutT (NUDIX family)
MVHEVVAALIVQDHQVLLGLRSPQRLLYPGVWDMFGGHVEPGEHHKQTLVRELQEELDITPIEWIFLETMILPLRTTPQEAEDELIVYLYRVSGWDGMPVNRQPEEHSTIGWFTLAQANRLSLAEPIYPALFARYL